MKKLSETQKKRIKSDQSYPMTIRIGSWFGRRATTNWSIYEVNALQELGAIDDEDLNVIEDYYLNFRVLNGFDPRRRDLTTLLNNWNGELDRARQWKKSKQSSETQPERQPAMYDMQQRYTFLDIEIHKLGEQLAVLDNEKQMALYANDTERHARARIERDNIAKHWQELCSKRKAVKDKMIQMSDKF